MGNNNERQKKKRIETLIDSDEYLIELGRKIAQIDSMLVSVLSKRMDEAKFVQAWKERHGNQPILRLEIEDKRIKQFSELAKQRKLNPHFAEAILYTIISESCRVQMDRLQVRHPEEEKLRQAKGDEWYNLLRDNLLALTDEIASDYDQAYINGASFATTSYLRFERNILQKEIQTLKGIGNTDLAVEIGCGTGIIATEQLAPNFKKVIGYDVSPAMIKQAGIKINGLHNTEFYKHDIEKGIPLESNSVSFLVMNFGTASDIRNIKLLINCVKRVLKKEGRFLFSFYNSQALCNRWFIPWHVALAAEINIMDHCLDVHYKEKIFRVYARPYTVREVRIFLEKAGFKISDKIVTYPTVSAILPNEFFQEDDSREAIERIDQILSHQENGAYILAAGRKVSD